MLLSSCAEASVVLNDSSTTIMAMKTLLILRCVLIGLILMFFTKFAFILLLCNKLTQVDKSILPNANGWAGLKRVAGLTFLGCIRRAKLDW